MLKVVATKNRDAVRKIRKLAIQLSSILFTAFRCGSTCFSADQFPPSKSPSAKLCIHSVFTCHFSSQKKFTICADVYPLTLQQIQLFLGLYHGCMTSVLLTVLVGGGPRVGVSTDEVAVGADHLIAIWAGDGHCLGGLLCCYLHGQHWYSGHDWYGRKITIKAVKNKMSIPT